MLQKNMHDSKKNIPKFTFDEFVNLFKNMDLSYDNYYNRNHMLSVSHMKYYVKDCNQKEVYFRNKEEKRTRVWNKEEKRTRFTSEYGHKWYLYDDCLDPEDYCCSIENFSRIHDFLRNNKSCQKFIFGGIVSLADFLDSPKATSKLRRDSYWISLEIDNWKNLVHTYWKHPLYLIPVRCIDDEDLFGFGLAIKFQSKGSTLKWVPNGFRFDMDDCYRIANELQEDV